MGLSPEQENIAIQLAADGKSIVEIQEVCKIDSRSFWKYREQYPKFARDFLLARQEGLEQLADSLITTADEYEDVQRGRLKSENIRWLLSKRKPLTYGDRLEVNMTQTVDIGAALLEAKNRVLLPMRYPEETKTVEAIDITDDKQFVPTDLQSVSDTKPEDEIDIFD
jgi:hypothetical protein